MNRWDRLLCDRAHPVYARTLRRSGTCTSREFKNTVHVVLAREYLFVPVQVVLLVFYVA
jgi:hypothetical protein